MITGNRKVQLVLFYRELQSNRLTSEGNSQVVILPKPDVRLKWTTEESFWKTFELFILRK